MGTGCQVTNGDSEVRLRRGNQWDQVEGKAESRRLGCVDVMVKDKTNILGDQPTTTAFFSASVFIYIPHKSYLPNTRARRNLINKGSDTCTGRSTRRGRRLGRFRKRLHPAPGRVERVIGSEDECLPATKCIRPHEADGDRMDARLCQGCDSCSQPAQRIVSLEFRPWPPTPNGQRGEKIMSPC